MVAVPQLCTLAIGFVIFCSSWRQGEAAVISIDLGSEWIKVALVKVSQQQYWSIHES